MRVFDDTQLLFPVLVATALLCISPLLVSENHFVAHDVFAIADHTIHSEVAGWLTEGWSGYFDNYPGWEAAATDFIRPVVNFSFWVDYHLWGWEHTVGYRLTNVLIHAANAFLVSYIAYRFFDVQRGLASLVAFYFLLVSRTTIIVVDQRTSALTGLFFLLTVAGYLRALKAPVKREWLWIGASVLCYLLALLSKETLLLGFLVFPLLGRYERRMGLKHCLSHGAAYATVFAGYLVIRFTAFGGLGETYVLQTASLSLLTERAVQTLLAYARGYWLPLVNLVDQMPAPFQLLNVGLTAFVVEEIIRGIIVGKGENVVLRELPLLLASLLLVGPALFTANLRFLYTSQAFTVIFLSKVFTGRPRSELGETIKKLWIVILATSCLSGAVWLVHWSVVEEEMAAVAKRQFETLSGLSGRLESYERVYVLNVSQTYSALSFVSLASGLPKDRLTIVNSAVRDYDCVSSDSQASSLSIERGRFRYRVRPEDCMQVQFAGALFPVPASGEVRRGDVVYQFPNGFQGVGSGGAVIASNGDVQLGVARASTRELLVTGELSTAEAVVLLDPLAESDKDTEAATIYTWPELSRRACPGLVEGMNEVIYEHQTEEPVTNRLERNSRGLSQLSVSLHR